MFSELMNYSKLEAAKYARDCGVITYIDDLDVNEYIKKHEGLVEDDEDVKGDEVVDTNENPEENKDAKKNEDEKTLENPEDEKVYTKEEIMELLDLNQIDYKKNFGLKRLLEIAETNNLL